MLRRPDEMVYSMRSQAVGKFEGDHGDIDLETPRDREGTFEPQILKKGQSRLTQMDDQILLLYAKRMSTWDICDTFKNSATLTYHEPLFQSH